MHIFLSSHNNNSTNVGNGNSSSLNLVFTVERLASTINIFHVDDLRKWWMGESQPACFLPSHPVIEISKKLMPYINELNRLFGPGPYMCTMFIGSWIFYFTKGPTVDSVSSRHCEITIICYMKFSLGSSPKPWVQEKKQLPPTCLLLLPIGDWDWNHTWRSKHPSPTIHSGAYTPHAWNIDEVHVSYS